MLSFMATQDIRVSAFAFVKVFWLGLLFFLVYPFLLTMQRRERILYCLGIGMIIGSALVILPNYITTSLLSPRAGLLGIMNYAGAVAILIPFMMAILLTTDNGNLKAVCGCAILSSIVGMMNNGTRGAWIACCFSMVLVLILFWRPRVKTALAGVVVVILIITIATKSEPFIQRVQATNAKTPSITLRLDMWQKGIEVWQDNKFIGVGFGMSPVHELVGLDRTTINWIQRSDYKHTGHLHNMYVQTLAETGVIGLMGLLVFWGNILYTYAVRFNDPKINIYVRASFAGTIGFLLHNMTDYALGIGTEFMLMLLIICVAYAAIQDNKGIVMRKER